MVQRRGGFRGGGVTPFSQRFEPLPIQKVRLCTIWRYQLLAMGPKKLLKAPLAPIYSKFKGGARRKKKHFFGLFFQNFACGAG